VPYDDTDQLVRVVVTMPETSAMPVAKHGSLRNDSRAFNIYGACIAVHGNSARALAGIAPRSISFKATLQVLDAFQPVISQQAHRGVEHLKSLYRQMLRAIAQHRVADRPDRFEPRMAKRRAKNYDRLTKPRSEIKRDMLKRFSEI
jgi:hypothetical protein